LKRQGSSIFVKERENLRIQYKQCLENYRMWDKHVWQTPSVAILFASAIVGVAFGGLEQNFLARTFVLIFGVALSLSLRLATIKHRFFQHYTIERLGKIEKELCLAPIPLVTNRCFRLEEKFRNDLNDKITSDEFKETLSDRLRKSLKDENFSLKDPKVKVLVDDKKWEITDNDRSYSIEYIGKALALKKKYIFSINKDNGVNPRTWDERRRAGRWLTRAVSIVTGILFALLIFNIVTKFIPSGSIKATLKDLLLNCGH